MTTTILPDNNHRVQRKYSAALYSIMRTHGAAEHDHHIKHDCVRIMVPPNVAQQYVCQPLALQALR